MATKLFKPESYFAEISSDVSSTVGLPLANALVNKLLSMCSYYIAKYPENRSFKKGLADAQESLKVEADKLIAKMVDSPVAPFIGSKILFDTDKEALVVSVDWRTDDARVVGNPNEYARIH